MVVNPYWMDARSENGTNAYFSVHYTRTDVRAQTEEACDALKAAVPVGNWRSQAANCQTYR